MPLVYDDPFTLETDEERRKREQEEAGRVFKGIIAGVQQAAQNAASQFRDIVNKVVVDLPQQAESLTFRQAANAAIQDEIKRRQEEALSNAPSRGRSQEEMDQLREQARQYGQPNEFQAAGETGALGNVAEFLQQPTIPEGALNQIRRVPVVGGATADILGGLSSPASLATLAVAPELALSRAGLASIGGSIAGGSLGEQVGGQQGRMIGELGGGLVAPVVEPALTRGVTGLAGTARLGFAEPAFALGLSADAEDLLNSLDKGASQPAFISKRLARIAADNGIEITNQTTPDEVVARLRDLRSQVGAEIPSSGITPEADKLVDDVLRGQIKLPKAMSDDLVRIAQDNGLTVAEDTTPNDVIVDLLRRRTGTIGEAPGGVPGGSPSGEPEISGGQKPPSGSPELSGGVTPPEEPSLGKPPLEKPSLEEPFLNAVEQSGQRGEPLPDNFRLLRPSALKSTAQIAADLAASIHDMAGSTSELAGHVPLVRNVINAINPSALIGAPPSEWTRALSQEGAEQLQSALIASARRRVRFRSLSSAMKDAVRQEARRVGFEMEDGLVVSVPGSPTIEELVTKTGDLKLTQGQRQLIEDLRSMWQDLNKTEMAAGVKRGEVTDGMYMFRLPMRSFTDADLRVFLEQNAPEEVPIGITRGFQKNREYVTMRQGLAAGQKYSSDLGAIVEARLLAGGEAIADRELQELTKPLGVDRITALRGLSGTERDPFALVTGINNFLRPMIAVGDVGQTSLQLWVGGANRPAAFVKSLGYMLDGLFTDSRLMGRYLLANPRNLEQAIGDGLLWNSSEFTHEEALQAGRLNLISGLLRKGPVGRFESGFTNSLNVAGLENYKAMMGLSGGPGGDMVRQVMRSIFGDISGRDDGAVAASLANKITGRLSTRELGVGAAQRSVETNLAFAARYYRAALGLLGDAMQGGMRGAEARRVLTALAGSTVALYYGVSLLTGQDPLDHISPLRMHRGRLEYDPEFLTVPVRGARIGVGGPIQSLIQAGAKIAASPGDTERILGQFGRGKAAPVLSELVDMVRGETYFGQKLDTPEAVLKNAAQRALPFAAQSLIQEGPASAIPSFTGLRAFPQSIGDRLDNMVAQAKDQGILRRTRADGTPVPSRFFDLDTDERQAVERSMPVAPELMKRAEQNRSTEQPFQLAQDKIAEQLAPIIAKQQAADDALRANPNDRQVASNWKRQNQDTLAEEASRRDAVYKALGVTFEDRQINGPVQAALGRYFAVKPEDFTDKQTLEFDDVAFWAARDKALEGLSPEQKAAVNQEVTKNMTPLQVQARDAARLLREAPPQFKGISKEREQQLDDFRRLVINTRAKLPGKIDDDVLANRMAKESGDPELGRLYTRTKPGSDSRAYLTSPAYYQYLGNNYDELNMFYPSIFTDTVLRKIGRGRRYSVPPLNQNLPAIQGVPVQGIAIQGVR